MGYNEIKKMGKKILKVILWVAGIIGGICTIALVFAIITFVVWYIENKPSKNKFDRRIGWEYFWNKDKNGECIIDLAEVMPFEWDSLVYTSPSWRFNTHYTKIMFMRNGNIVYYADWFPYPYEEHPGGVVFMHEGDMLTVYPHDAKFKAYKDDKSLFDSEGKFILLKKVE